MWKHDAPQGNESSKTRWRAVPFIRGTGLDIGCGREKLMDTQFVIGIDDNSDLGRFNIQANANIYMDCKDFGRFSSGAYDFAFSSHLLEHFYYKDVPAVLREWMRVVRIGGHLVLYLPDEDQYPKCAEPERNLVAEDWVNKDHKWNVNYDRVVDAMSRSGHNWDLVYFEKCKDDDEYSLFFAFKKLK